MQPVAGKFNVNLLKKLYLNLKHTTTENENGETKVIPII